ncbi:type II toxin-antitoxin system VapC family toxin [Erwinia psidii]|uniref:type II toxin-antitoxin system VapC family toxin n=1 Tax=Erwinia psidii TaxID=69224 RepID=UPI00226B08E1|nr:type II toxin-antitoxin system VapC family toxin [Erwinia psidii]
MWFRNCARPGTPKIDDNVARWAATVDAGDLFISAITLMEIERGILSLARRGLAQASVLRKWFECQVQPEFAHRCLPVDADIALHCARLPIADKRSATDALIASTAFWHDMIVVTRHTQDFDGLGVELINP